MASHAARSDAPQPEVRDVLRMYACLLFGSVNFAAALIPAKLHRL
jgi:hypothetical protein